MAKEKKQERVCGYQWSRNGNIKGEGRQEETAERRDEERGMSDVGK